MSEKAAIDGVKACVSDLNAALAELPTHGIDAEINNMPFQRVGDRSETQMITVHMTRTKTEIDERA